MAIARIENNQVVETRTIALSDVPEHKRHLWRNIIGDPPSSSLSYSGQTYEVTATHVVCTWTPLAPSQADYAAAIQAHMETVAQSRGYQDADRLASYTTSGNATWSAEAVTFSAWRDAVWAYSFEQMAAVQSGVRQAPTVDGLIAELPAIDWQEFPITELQVALDRIVALEQALGEFATRLNAQ